MSDDERTILRPLHTGKRYEFAEEPSPDDAHGISPALITETPQVNTRAGSGGV